MQYMIHACPDRMWYVERFLLPSLEGQGIPREEVCVWCDVKGLGNLISFVESCRLCGKLGAGGVWHLQDDVVLVPDFARRTREISEGLACGFGCATWDAMVSCQGAVPVKYAWYSFPCIRIPNALAGEFAVWFDTARRREELQGKVADRKHDDYFFRLFMTEQHSDAWALNVSPCLVDHIDWLIGGTVINRTRPCQYNRAAYWEHPEVVDALAARLHETPGGPLSP